MTLSDDFYFIDFFIIFLLFNFYLNLIKFLIFYLNVYLFILFINYFYWLDILK